MQHKFPPYCICTKALDTTEQQVDRWIRDNQSSKPWLANLFRRYLGNKPTCQWLGDWSGHVYHPAKRIADHARANNALYQVVLYNIPNRDNGQFSSGGAKNREEYLSWVGAVAAGLGDVEGLAIIEPDALAHAEELDHRRKAERLQMIKDAVKILRDNCKNVHIYIDAGHPEWLEPRTVIDLLFKAGIQNADGIALNVSNTIWTDACYNYGLKITEAISERHGMVIDTSRNGAGPPPLHITGIARWANPTSSRLGEAPTLRVRRPNNYSHRLHALLWVKTPGESDGNHNGAPRAGMFYPDGALSLIGQRASGSSK